MTDAPLLLSDVIEHAEDEVMRLDATFEDLIAPHGRHCERPVFDERTGAAPCRTSGTTSNPKAMKGSSATDAAMAAPRLMRRRLEGCRWRRAQPRPNAWPECIRRGSPQSTENAGCAIAHHVPPPDPQPSLSTP